VLRLDFVPDSVTVGGKAIGRVAELGKGDGPEGYSFDEKTHVLRLRHASSRDVDIQGKGGAKPVAYVTFDDPHLAAGTPLEGRYPSAIIDWGRWSGNGGAEGDRHTAWEIGTPFGKFGTFTLRLADGKTHRAGFDFTSPRVFAGIDVYNDGDRDATVTVSSPENREILFPIQAKELRRLRTGWRDPSSRVWFDVVNGEGLRFDNLAYVHP